MTGIIIINMCVRIILFNSALFDAGTFINNDLFLWYITSDTDILTYLIVFTYPQENSEEKISRTFEVTLHAIKPITLVHVSKLFWSHRLILPLLMSLFFKINLSPLKGPILWLKTVYSLQNKSSVTYNS